MNDDDYYGKNYIIMENDSVLFNIDYQYVSYSYSYNMNQDDDNGDTLEDEDDFQ